MQPRIALLILLSALFCIPAASGQTVLFDSSTGFFGLDDYGPCGYSFLRDELVLAGYQATDSLSLKLDCAEITDKELGNAHLLVIVNPNRDISWVERSRILNALASGGNVLLVCDRLPTIGHANSLARPFGVEFQECGHSTLTADIDGSIVQFIAPLALECGDQAEGAFVQVNGTTVFAGYQYGKGKIGFLSDADLLTNSYVEDYGADFPLTVINWFFDSGRASVRYTPEHLTVASGDEGLLLIENTGEVNQHFSVSFMPSLCPISVSEDEFTVAPGEKKILTIAANTAAPINYRNLFMVINRQFQLQQVEDYIPIEVIRSAA